MKFWKKPNLPEMTPAARIVATLAFIGLAGCASAPRAWVKADGATPTSGDLQAAVAICKGQVATAASQGGGYSTMGGLLGPDRTDRQIYEGCMAQHGYLAGQ